MFSLLKWQVFVLQFCVVLQNIALMNWLLKQTYQDAEVVYKYGRGAVIKPHQYLTVCTSHVS